MPSQRSKGGASARSRGSSTPLPTKSGGSAAKGTLCGCPKQHLYLAGVAFCVIYTLAFLSVVRHHQQILAYLHKKEDQIMHKRDMDVTPTSVASASGVPVRGHNQAREKPKTKAYEKDASVEAKAKSNTRPIEGQGKEDSEFKSTKSISKMSMEVKAPSVDCKRWKLTDVDAEIDYSTFVNQAALKKQQNLQKSNLELAASSYISPWLYIVVPVIDASPSPLRKTVRSIFNELNSAPGGLYDGGVVQVLVVNMGGGEAVASTLSMLRDEIKDYPFASAFTFVRSVNRNDQSSKRHLLTGNTEEKAVFQNSCLMERKSARGAVELTSRGIAFLSYVIPRVFKSMEVDLCHSFVILKAGQTFCQYGLPFLHYALGKADEYNWDWTSVRMSRDPISGTAFKCNIKQNTEMAEALFDIGKNVAQEVGDKDSGGTVAPMNEKKLMEKYLARSKHKHEHMVFKQTLLAGKCTGAGPLPGYDMGKCSGTDISPCEHSAIDSSLRYVSKNNNRNHLDGMTEIVVGSPGQSCTEACETQSEGRLACDHVEANKLSTCYHLRGVLNCQMCRRDIKMSGMSGITSSSGYDNGKCQYTANTCVYGKQSGGQASCGSKELALRRVCACTKKENIGSKNGDAEAQKDKSGGVTVAGDYGESCIDVCRKRDMECEDAELKAVNNCNSLNVLFKCSKCERNEGPDQPCQVNPSAGLGTHGECLLKSNIDTLTCNGKHPNTRRACVCFPKL